MDILGAAGLGKTALNALEQSFAQYLEAARAFYVNALWHRHPFCTRSWQSQTVLMED